MSNADIVIFYDIPATEPKQKAWSPNTWKTRYSLNYKGLPYKTEWVEYPDIEALCKKHGAPPTEKKADGRPHYTLPMIYDPKTKTAVVESAEIVRYLDKTYPDTPKLFPPGTDALQAVFLDLAWPRIGLPLFMNIIQRTCTALTPRSAAYFRATREVTFGSKLEKLGGDGDWEALKEAMDKVYSWLSANGPGKDDFFLGDEICFSDIQLVSLLIWARVICGEDSEDWKTISSWHGGKWNKLVEYFDQYAAVDI